MKKWIPILVVAALLMAALPVGTFAHSEEDPFEVPLCAGQCPPKGEYAGTVSVWNDGDNLYVKFETTGGWLMEETHLYVGTQPPEESAPGQFPYKHEDLGGVTEDPYTISLAEIGAGAGEDVYIAAHAALLMIIGDGCASPQWASTVVDSSQGTLVGGGPITDPARIDPSAALGAPDASTSPPATGFYSLGFVSGNNGYLVLGFDYPVFNGPGDDIVAYEVTWGRPGYPEEKADVYVIADGAEQYAGTVTNHDDGGVGTVSIPDGPLCVDEVKLVDATDPALFSSKPNADGYDLDAVGACYLCGGEETAWGEGYRIRPDKNWAMYFPYTVQAPPACPEMSFSGPIQVLSTPPESVAKDGLTSGEYVRVFEEFAGSVTDLPLDIPGTGTSPLTGAVCSYYVHLDMGSSSSGDLRAVGSLTFDDNVVGLIIRGSSVGSYPGDTLCETNGVLGADGTYYGTNCGAGNDQRGLEIGSTLYPPAGTNDGVQIDGDTVNFSLRVIPQYHDAFRIILPYD